MDAEHIPIIIKRKPATGSTLRELPTSQEKINELKKYTDTVNSICQNQRDVTVENVRDVVRELCEIEFEFPRHLMEPLFHMANRMMHRAIDTNQLYQIEVLLDALAYMGARNVTAEKKHAELAGQAQGVAAELIKVLNLDFNDNIKLLKALVENLNKAEEIGMRGEVIDVALTFKILCTNKLQEMLKSGSEDGEDEDMQAVFTLGEDDRNRNVYDPAYDEHIEAPDELIPGIEPNLAMHPFATDYMKVAMDMNLRHLEKQMTESRKQLMDEESYRLVTIFTRCAFILSDGGVDANQEQDYTYARGDYSLKLTRLIFRYRLNSEKLFDQKQEPQALDPSKDLVVVQKQKKNKKGKEPEPLRKQWEDILPDNFDWAKEPELKEYKLLSREAQFQNRLEYDTKLLTKPLLQGTINGANAPLNQNRTDCAIAINKALHNICESMLILPSAAARDSSSMPHRSVIHNSTTPMELFTAVQDFLEQFVIDAQHGISNVDLHDEILMQLFRLINKKEFNKTSGASEKDIKSKIDSTANTLLVLRLFSRYAMPSDALKMNYIANLIKRFSHLEALTKPLREIIHNLLRRKKAPNEALYVPVAPSLSEIEAYSRNAKLQIKVHLYTAAEPYRYSVTEATTVESLLQEKIWEESYFQKEPDKEAYWLYVGGGESVDLNSSNVKSEDDEWLKFATPVPREKKICELLYKMDKVRQRNVRLSDNSIPTINLNPQGHGAVKKSTTEVTDVPQLNFYMRKRLFSTLHHDRPLRTLDLIGINQAGLDQAAPPTNFKALSSRALNMLFYQLRYDYVEKQLISKLETDVVAHLAALALKIKVHNRKQTFETKQNSITKELVRKHIRFAVPGCLRQYKTQGSEIEELASTIYKSAEENGIADKNLQEAQIEFLEKLAEHEIMFASYYVGSRIGTNTNSQHRLTRPSMFAQMQTKVIQKKKFQKKTINAESSSEEESDSQSSESEGAETLQEEKSFLDVNHKENLLQNSKIKQRLGGKQIPEEELDQRIAIFDEYFRGTSSEILFVCTYNSLLFFENKNRTQQPLLRVRYQDLLYVMGKKKKLKLRLMLQPKTMPVGDHENTHCDVWLEFHVGSGARTMAEDIIANCQLQLMEMSPTAEIQSNYLEMVRRNIIDLLNESNNLHPQQVKDTTLDDASDSDSLQDGHRRKKIKMNVVVNDDLFLGTMKTIDQHQPAHYSSSEEDSEERMDRMVNINEQKPKISMRDRRQTFLRAQGLGNMEETNDGWQEDQDESVGSQSIKRAISKDKQQIHLQKMRKQFSHQLRFKRPEQLIYMRKHPTHIFTDAKKEEPKSITTFSKNDFENQQRRHSISEGRVGSFSGNKPVNTKQMIDMSNHRRRGTIEIKPQKARIQADKSQIEALGRNSMNDRSMVAKDFHFPVDHTIHDIKEEANESAESDNTKQSDIKQKQPTEENKSAEHDDVLVTVHQQLTDAYGSMSPKTKESLENNDFHSEIQKRVGNSPEGIPQEGRKAKLNFSRKSIVEGYHSNPQKEEKSLDMTKNSQESSKVKQSNTSIKSAKEEPKKKPIPIPPPPVVAQKSLSPPPSQTSKPNSGSSAAQDRLKKFQQAQRAASGDGQATPTVVAIEKKKTIKPRMLLDVPSYKPKDEAEAKRLTPSSAEASMRLMERKKNVLKPSSPIQNKERQFDQMKGKEDRKIGLGMNLRKLGPPPPKKQPVAEKETPIVPVKYDKIASKEERKELLKSKLGGIRPPPPRK